MKISFRDKFLFGGMSTIVLDTTSQKQMLDTLPEFVDFILFANANLVANDVCVCV